MSDEVEVKNAHLSLQFVKAAGRKRSRFYLSCNKSQQEWVSLDGALFGSEAARCKRMSENDHNFLESFCWQYLKSRERDSLLLKKKIAFTEGQREGLINLLDDQISRINLVIFAKGTPLGDVKILTGMRDKYYEIIFKLKGLT